MSIVQFIVISFGEGILPTIGGVTMGGIAFALFGCRSVLNFNDNKGGTRWLTSLSTMLKYSLSINDKEINVVKWVIIIITAVLCGISLFSFGGGIVRDVIILKRIPWFIKDMHVLLIITIIILVYIVVYQFIKKKQLCKLRKYAFFTLVIFDVYGLYEFAELGQQTVVNIMGNTSYIYIFVCGLATQLGGGLIASVIRWDLPSTLKQNIWYYGLALLINTALFFCRLIENTSLLPFILPLGIISGLLINDITRKNILLIMNVIMRNIQNAAAILAAILQTEPYIIYDLVIPMQINQVNTMRSKRDYTLNYAIHHYHGCIRLKDYTPNTKHWHKKTR